MSFIPTQSTLTVGKRVFTDLQNLITLLGYVGTNQYTTFRKVNASSGYQVPGGKSFQCAAIRANVFVAGGATYVYGPSYGDNDVGLGSATPPTGIVVPGGGSAQTDRLFETSQLGIQESSVDFLIPATKYPFAVSNGAIIVTFTLWGYEV